MKEVLIKTGETLSLLRVASTLVIKSTWTIVNLSPCPSQWAGVGGKALVWVYCIFAECPEYCFQNLSVCWFLFTKTRWKRVQITLRIEHRTFSEILKSFCLKGIRISWEAQSWTKYISGHLSEFSHNNSQVLLWSLLLGSSSCSSITGKVTIFILSWNWAYNYQSSTSLQHVFWWVSLLASFCSFFFLNLFYS